MNWWPIYEENLIVGGISAVLIAREIGNGIWAIAALEMFLFFSLDVFGRIWGVMFGRQLKFFEATREEPVHPFYLPDWFDQPMQWGTAFMMFVAGTMIRAQWAWEFSICVRRNLKCEFVRSELAAGSLWIAVVMAVVGALCFIRLVSPPQWRTRAVLCCATLCIAVPLIRFYA
jgi:hypothetical protein